MHLRQLSFVHARQDKKKQLSKHIKKSQNGRLKKGRCLLGFEVSSLVLGRKDKNQTQGHCSFPQWIHFCSHTKRQQHYSHQHPPVWHHLVNLETNIKIKDISKNKSKPETQPNPTGFQKILYEKALLALTRN